MITFKKKAATLPEPDKGQENRFEQIRKTAKEKHRVLDADAARRGDASAKDDTLI